MALRGSYLEALLVAVVGTLLLLGIVLGLSHWYLSSTGWLERRDACHAAGGVWLGRAEVCVQPLEEEGRGR